MKIVYTNRTNLADLDVYECGSQQCSIGHSVGPSVREFFLVHYVVEGKGVFNIQGKTYYPEQGMGFVIYPGVIAHYQPDENSPWHYNWVAFNGTKAEAFLRKAGLTLENPKFEIADIEVVKDYFNKMMDSDKLKNGRELFLTGFLYQLLAIQIEEYTKKNPFSEITNRSGHYVNIALRFIQTNFARDLNLEQIANQVGLDAKYLSALFKEQLNISPYRLLINIRMEKACEMMNNEMLTIGDISRSVGYKDTFLFSRMFKKLKGLSPRDYRKQVAKN